MIFSYENSAKSPAESPAKIPSWIFPPAKNLHWNPNQGRLVAVAVGESQTFFLSSEGEAHADWRSRSDFSHGEVQLCSTQAGHVDLDIPSGYD